ncbi:MAG TPA: endonuclease/exonuclease/phosphatase family protein [Candidatus Limnocylindria bacterium]|nr:endonuclease/exonuclease/phosphatase family protein [Candidatus Limnocylindria bacterium]
MDAPTLRVATWNLQARDPAAVGIAELLATDAPDVLLFQEARTDLLDRFEGLMGHPHRVLRPDAGSRPGQAIFSRVPIEATGQVDPPAGRPRLVWARLAVPATSGIVVASFHSPVPFGRTLTDNPWRRFRHLRSIAAFATDLARDGVPTVLGGDANALRYAIDGYTDAAHDRSWRPVGGLPWLPPVARIDRIFVGPGLRVTSAGTRCRISRSDHCPVVVTVEPAARGV